MFNRSSLRAWAALLLVASWTVAAHAGDDPPKDDADKMEKAEGVIVKVDRGDDQLKLTINTAAVWSDYVPRPGHRRREAEGRKELDRHRRRTPHRELRHRRPGRRLHQAPHPVSVQHRRGQRRLEDDPEGRAEGRDGQLEGRENGRRATRRPRSSRPRSLRSARFVEVESKKGVAHRLVVLRPVGGPQTPASEAVKSK